MKNKDILWTGSLICLSFILFLFTNFFCENSCYLFIGDQRIDIFFQWLVWFVVIVLVLVLLFKNVFIPWMKHIAWWYMYFVPWFVVNFSDSMFFSEQWLLTASMIFLTVITLIYAFVMNSRLKKNE